MFRWVTKRELTECNIEEVTNQFESSVNLIRRLLDTEFVQLSSYRPFKNQKQGRYILYRLYSLLQKYLTWPLGAWLIQFDIHWFVDPTTGHSPSLTRMTRS